MPANTAGAVPGDLPEFAVLGTPGAAHGRGIAARIGMDEHGALGIQRWRFPSAPGCPVVPRGQPSACSGMTPEGHDLVPRAEIRQVTI